MMRAVNVLPTAPTVNIMPAVNAVGIGNVLLTVNVMPTVNAAAGRRCGEGRRDPFPTSGVGSGEP